jgi:hypothetical protein
MSDLWRRLRMLFHRDRFDRDLEEEMQFHLEMTAEENCRTESPLRDAAQQGQLCNSVTLP